VGWAQKADQTVELPKLRIVNADEVAFSINAGEFYSYTLPQPRGADCENQPKIGGIGVNDCLGVRGDMFIEANVDQVPADRVRLVVFNPRCETENLDIAMHGKGETRKAKCVAVPIWKFKGRIVDDALTEVKGLKVRVAYQANWAPRFLGVEKIGVDQPPPEPPQFDVMTVAVSKDRSFPINLPIYVHDRAEENAEAGMRGELVFTLLNAEPKVPVVLGALRPDKFATASGGLELRAEYPELRFMVEHER
jgi:hypothetical protein